MFFKNECPQKIRKIHRKTLFNIREIKIIFFDKEEITFNIKNETLAQMFSCEFLKVRFLQTTPRRLLLYLPAIILPLGWGVGGGGAGVVLG